MLTMTVLVKVHQLLIFVATYILLVLNHNTVYCFYPIDTIRLQKHGESYRTNRNQQQQQQLSHPVPTRTTTMASPLNEPPITTNSMSRNVTIGFIGCGTIASAIVTGLAKKQLQQLQEQLEDVSSTTTSTIPTRVTISRIIVTKRSESKSSALQFNYPNLINIYDNNQDIVNECDIIFLTVLPKHLSTILQSLQFDPKRHVIISLVSTSQLETLCYDTKLPIYNIYKLICLPAVAYNDGVCLLQHVPDNDNGNAIEQPLRTGSVDRSVILNILHQLGNVVIVHTNEEMASCMVPSGLMGMFYGILRNNRNWILSNMNNNNDNNNSTINKREATKLILRYYNNMLQDAIRRIESSTDDDKDDDEQIDPRIDILDELIHEQTKGGLNEQALYNGGELLHILNSYEQIQDAMYLRIIGKTDGTILQTAATDTTSRTTVDTLTLPVVETALPTTTSTAAATTNQIE